MPECFDCTDTRFRLPGWLPVEVAHYFRHTECGHSIRGLAREDGVAASTVLRRIAKCEQRRDDLLVDEGLTRLGQAHRSDSGPNGPAQEMPHMTMPKTIERFPEDEATIEREARRILRRLSEPGAVLAVAPGMAKAGVFKAMPDGRTTRTALVERPVAEAFALKDWITCNSDGKVAKYRITSAGQAALKRMLAEDRETRRGLEEVQSPFEAQHRDMVDREVDLDDGGRQRVRFNRSESPVAMLARRRDTSTGQPFLSADLVVAAERLREDFELAQMGPRVTQNWESFLTAGTRGSFSSDKPIGPEASRARVQAALAQLGPGLGDMVLRCCCFLEGLEATEKRMGWSARSGKIVLRIALQQLKRHYDDTYGPHGPMIG